MKIKTLLWCLVLCVFVLIILGRRQSLNRLPEPNHTKELAVITGGKAEVTTPVGTRCDLVSDTHTIEVEWASKAYEAIGQSLHYSLELAKEPGILFLVESDKDIEFASVRANKVCRLYKIDVWWYNVKTKVLHSPEEAPFGE